MKALLYAGCKVISGGRSIDAAKKSFHEAGIIDNLNKNLIVYELDLESLSSIKAFTDKCLTESSGRIDYLILNAGIMALPTLEYTRHGFEKQIGTNHYGHYTTPGCDESTTIQIKNHFSFIHGSCTWEGRGK